MTQTTRHKDSTAGSLDLTIPRIVFASTERRLWLLRLACRGEWIGVDVKRAELVVEEGTERVMKLCGFGALVTVDEVGLGGEGGGGGACGRRSGVERGGRRQVQLDVELEGFNTVGIGTLAELVGGDGDVIGGVRRQAKGGGAHRGGLCYGGDGEFGGSIATKIVGTGAGEGVLETTVQVGEGGGWRMDS